MMKPTSSYILSSRRTAARFGLTLGLWLLVWAPLRLVATHNLAGQITAARNDPNNPNSYEITLTTYTDPAPAGVDRCSADFEIWSFNGPSPVQITIIADVARANGGPMINPNDCTIPNPLNGVVVKGTVKRNIYRATYIFPGPGVYEIYYFDVARHGSVVNMNNPEEQAFFVNTRLFIPPPIIGSNNTPLLLNEPLDDACIGKHWTHNPGAIDPDGDSLAYSLVPSYHYDPAQSNLPQVADGYRWPDDPSFGPATFTIDSITGVVTWDVPQQLGIYNFGIKIEEYRNGQLLGFVVRDIAVWVLDCDNNPPVIETISDTCVYAGDTLRFEYLAYDPDLSDSLYLDLNNGVLGDNGPFSVPNRATLSGTVVDPRPGFSVPYTSLPVSTRNNGTEPVDTIKGTITWLTLCDNIRTQRYQVDFVASDNKLYALPNVQSTTLTAHKAVTIRVVAPPPQELTATKGSRTITLDWLPPVCADRVVGYYVYRKVGGGYTGDTLCCEMSPLAAGFERIATLEDALTLSVVDSLNNISGGLGEEICYVVTALYDDPVLPGIPALESCATEACVELTTEPLYLTNDSVATTDPVNGSIFVSWSQPVIDPIFPGPYVYHVYRANNNAFPAIRIATQAYADTTLLDTGLDTEVRGYNYRVEVFDALGLLVNTSEDTHIGSSIYLTATGGGSNYIDLSWTEFVPWTNSSYEIYRSDAGAPFALIATVAGTGANTHTYQDQNLNPAVEYCYFIRSYGSHGVAGIKDPLVNDSQVACDFAQDDEPPCNPDVLVNGSCETLRHTVRITKSTLGCDSDAETFTLLYANNVNGPYNVVATFPYAAFGSDTVLVYEFGANDPQFAGCYAVTVTDTLGNTSELSTGSCVDYCPALIMGNVFSPNADGINDIFRPRVWRDVRLRECRIYDRWGRVMATTTGDIDSLWDGIRESSGRPAPAGVYYYHLSYEELGLGGNVLRETTGWVTLLR